MFSAPKGGWANLTIDSWTDRASYLTDVPHDVLDVLIEMFGHRGRRTPASVSFDAEGWEYIVVFDYYDVHIITDKCDDGFRRTDDNDSGFRLLSFEKHAADLALEICDDIERDIDAWADWDFGRLDEDELRKNKDELLVKVGELRGLVEKYRNR